MRKFRVVTREQARSIPVRSAKVSHETALRNLNAALAQTEKLKRLVEQRRREALAALEVDA